MRWVLAPLPFQDKDHQDAGECFSLIVESTVPNARSTRSKPTTGMPWPCVASDRYLVFLYSTYSSRWLWHLSQSMFSFSTRASCQKNFYSSVRKFLERLWRNLATFKFGATSKMDDILWKERYSRHGSYERAPNLAKNAKTNRLEFTGKLQCDVCSFDFGVITYGEFAKGFIEAHHSVPRANSCGKRKTKLSEITLVCSNCHRMLHRGETLLSIEELTRINTRSSAG